MPRRRKEEGGGGKVSNEEGEVHSAGEQAGNDNDQADGMGCACVGGDHKATVENMF